VLIVVPEGFRGLTPVRRLSSQWVVLLLFECGASFLRDYAGSGLCGGVGASELFDC
jgi:hypothetical protein